MLTSQIGWMGIITLSHKIVPFCLSGGIPFYDTRLLRLSLNKRKAPEVIPSNTFSATEVCRNLPAYFFRNHQSLSHSILTKEERTIRLCIRGESTELGFCDIVLLNEARTFVLPDFTIIDHLEALITILIHRFKVVLHATPRSRMRDSEILIPH